MRNVKKSGAVRVAYPRAVPSSSSPLAGASRVASTLLARAHVLATLAGGFALATPSFVAAQSGMRAPPLSPISSEATTDAAARFGALRASPSSTVARVEEEHVGLACTPEPGGFLRCTLEARWRLTSSADTELNLYASAASLGEVHFVSGDVDSDAPSLHPLHVTIAAGAHVDVVLRGAALVPASSHQRDPLLARHLALATPLEGPHGTVLFVRAIAHTFADPTDDAPRAGVSVDAELPAAHHLETLDASGTHVELGRDALGERASLALRIEREDDHFFRHGGPFLGLGATIDRNVRVRLGYELGLGELVLAQVAIDTDFQELFEAAALVEVATPSFLIPPSLGAGAGFVFRGAPRTSAGLRLEASAVFAVVGVVASFDYFPDDGAFATSILGRLSI